MKIGIYGGSFNPIHKGHMHVANAAVEQMNLDLLYLMPSYLSPNKMGFDLILPEHRIKMCEISASDNPRIYVSDLEACNEQVSYTYITLQKMKEMHPNDELFFVLGADSLDYLEDWKNPEIICSLSSILVLEREGFSSEETMLKIDEISAQYNTSVYLLSAGRYDASSTQIRAQLQEHPEECPADLDERVYDYIKSNHIYGI